MYSVYEFFHVISVFLCYPNALHIDKELTIDACCFRRDFCSDGRIGKRKCVNTVGTVLVLRTGDSQGKNVEKFSKKN